MNKNILVIDDEESIRKSFVLALMDSGYNVDCAESGERGIKMLNENLYNLIYLDLKMPGMNGVETLRELRKQDPNIPIYIITAFHKEFLYPLKDAMEEGIVFKFLTAPVKYHANKRGWVSTMECIQMVLGAPDDSGRRRPVPIEDSNFIMEVDVVVIAIGNRPNPLVPSTTEGLDTTKWGTLVADEETGKTTKDLVWAGGDIVTGAATVISAMGAGKKATAAMHKKIMNIEDDEKGEEIDE